MSGKLLKARLNSITDFLGEAIAQVLFVLFFSFMPFAGLALPSLGRNPGMWNTFLSYFNNGEIAFLTFGVVGSVFWCAFSRATPQWLKVICTLASLATLWFSASLLGDIASQSEEITTEQRKLMFVLYIVTMVAWSFFLLSKPNRSHPFQSSDADALFEGRGNR